MFKRKPPTPATGSAKAVALYEYTGNDTGELSFREGEIISVTNQNDNDGWWEGELNGKKGWFPATYVQIQGVVTTPPPPVQQQQQFDDDDDDKDYKSSTKPSNIRYSSSTNLQDWSAPIDETITQFYTIKRGMYWDESETRFLIIIGSPEKKSKFSGIKKYTAYEIETQGISGNGRVSRRYKHFDWLRERLVEQFPALAIPSLPEKQFGGRFEEEFIETRRRLLARWMNRLAFHPLIRSAKVFHHFLQTEDYKDWKAGKRTAEKDKTRGRVFFNSIVFEEFPADGEEQIDKYKKYSVTMEKNFKLLVAAGEHLMVAQKNSVAGSLVRFGQAISTLAISGEAGTMCWRGNCDECHALTNAFNQMVVTNNMISTEHREQSKKDVINVIDTFREYQRLLHSTADALKPQEHIAHQYHSLNNKAAQEDTIKIAQMRKNHESALAAALAETQQFHYERLVDFKQVMVEHINQQIQFHQKITQYWQDLLPHFANIEHK